MTKQTAIFHNGTSRHISDFSFNGTVASGYVQGKFVKGEVADYSYDGYTHHRPKNEVSKAKHYLIDLHDMTYGNTVMTNAERGRLSTSRLRVRNTHVKRLSDGRCKATGYVDGTLVTIYYDGCVESNYTGELKEAKPWLGDVREDLEFKHFEMVVNDTVEKLKVLSGRNATVVMEALKNASIVA